MVCNVTNELLLKQWLNILKKKRVEEKETD